MTVTARGSLGAGSLAPGKDGDLAFYNGHPLSPYSRCVLTLIDGEVVFDDRQGFYQENVDAASFFARMYIPIDDLESAMFDASQTSYDEAVTNYIEANPARIEYWVTGRIGS